MELAADIGRGLLIAVIVLVNFRVNIWPLV